MLTGLLANALGYRHRDGARLQALQARLRYAVRCDRPGKELQDYQTVGLSQDFLKEGWTSSGLPEGREGGSAKTGTHIRYRDYLADAIYTLAVTLDPLDELPGLEEMAGALRAPARPLFIGRKTCLPAGPLLIDLRNGSSLLTILQSIPVPSARAAEPPWRAWWPADETADSPGSRLIAVTDDRDWLNQIHTGRRWMREGTIHG